MPNKSPKGQQPNRTRAERLAFLESLTKALDIPADTIAITEDGVLHYYFNDNKEPTHE